MALDELAAYFGVDPDIEAFIPELLVDFYELGSAPSVIVDLIRKTELPESGGRLIDLGCGKGAVSIEIARELGLSAFGVDGIKAFIDEAQKKAQKEGLEKLCTFEHGDLVKTVKSGSENYDLALLISVGDVLGPMDECIAALRKIVRPGGYLIIDDGYIEQKEKVDFPGYEYIANHQEMIDQLTSQGDQIVEEYIFPNDQVRKQNALYQNRIEGQVKNLSQRYPEHQASFEKYLEKEKEENKILNENIICATWVIKVQK